MGSCLLPLLWLYVGITCTWTKIYDDDVPALHNTIDKNIQRSELNYTFGIASFLQRHLDNPMGIYRIFFDEEHDEYESVHVPKKPGDNIVKVRKDKYTLSPKVEEQLLEFIHSRGIPELSEYIQETMKKDEM